jgi:hypothetical protein
MARMLKIDFHTHPVEALKDRMGIRGIRDITVEVAAAIVKAVKTAGLAGIAITEYNNFNHSWVTALQIRDHFQKENLIILPGVELDFQGQQFLQIFIPGFYRKRIPFFKGQEWFWVLAHPGYYTPLDAGQFEQVRFDAVEEQSIHGEFSLAASISQSRNIPRMKSSDAHKLEDIGLYYTEIESR